jgi:GAF domain-containing protein
MSDDDRLLAAVAAGVLAARAGHRTLLQSIAEVARLSFGAKSSSIMLLDETTEELVFEAVAGEGEGRLPGMRLPPRTGLTGWVASSGQPLAIEDVAADPRFAADQADRTGYVPKGMMVAPLMPEDRVLGVFSVLDRPERRRFSVAEMDLLQLFATQAAVAVDVLLHARRVGALLAGGGDQHLQALAELAATLDALDERRRAGSTRLLTELDATLGR